MGLSHFSGPMDSANGFRQDGSTISGFDYTHEDFESQAASSLAVGGAASGTANALNILTFERNSIPFVAKGTQTILSPSLKAAGFDINQDQTDNDGIELGGSHITRGRHGYTIGTSPSFFFEVKFSIADVSGTDDCAIGFRKAQAYQANFDDYTDAATLNVISGAITIETILNNAATTSTDTTDAWADGESHTLTVNVNKSGAVTYQIDGVSPTVIAAFTFDTGDVVFPFIFMLNAADVAGEVALTKWEVGPQEFRGQL